MIRRALALLFAILMAFSAAPAALAQTADSAISVSVSPEHPAPYDNVTITLSSFSMDLSSARVLWKKDGAGVLSGIGKTEYTFTARASGQPTAISVTITTLGGGPVNKSITITPSGVDILWQAADSYVPPFYRGKALPASEASIRFVAMPDMRTAAGVLASPKDLEYTWSYNHDLDQNASGFGKNSFTISSSYLNAREHIDLTASTQGGASSAENALDITTGSPKIVWYATSPLYGPVFEHSIGNNYSVSGSEAVVLAAPYFFSPKDFVSPNLSYKWKLNGAPIDTPSTINSLYLHRDTNSSGDASIDLSITNVVTLFQEATSRLSLHLQ